MRKCFQSGFGRFVTQLKDKTKKGLSKLQSEIDKKLFDIRIEDDRDGVALLAAQNFTLLFQ